MPISLSILFSIDTLMPKKVINRYAYFILKNKDSILIKKKITINSSDSMSMILSPKNIRIYFFLFPKCFFSKDIR